MVKFIEVFEQPREYNEELGMCKTDYSLREVFINPKYIISMRQSERLQNKFRKGTLMADLNKNAQFTQLIVANSEHASPKTYHVVGDAESLLNKMGVVK
tara:strand:- start:362 stop:658 length:297 start_codon:yes stop_codon:yes gene_type:complete